MGRIFFKGWPICFTHLRRAIPTIFLRAIVALGGMSNSRSHESFGSFGHLQLHAACWLFELRCRLALSGLYALSYNLAGSCQHCQLSTRGEGRHGNSQILKHKFCALLCLRSFSPTSAIPCFSARCIVLVTYHAIPIHPSTSRRAAVHLQRSFKRGFAGTLPRQLLFASTHSFVGISACT